MPQSPELKNFFRFLVNFRSLGGWASRVLIGSPFFAGLLRIAPEVPTFGKSVSGSHLVVGSISSLAVFVILMATFCIPIQMPRKFYAVSLAAGTLGFFVGLWVYLDFCSRNTFWVPGRGLNAMGTVLSDESDLLLQNEVVNSVYELLEFSEYRADKVWTPESVGSMRRSWIVSWVVWVSLTSALFGLFLKHAERQDELKGIEMSARSIFDLDLSRRTAMLLHEAGISTIGDVCSKTKIEIESVRGIGESRRVEVEHRIGEFGLSLRKTQ